MPIIPKPRPRTKTASTPTVPPLPTQHAIRQMEHANAEWWSQHERDDRRGLPLDPRDPRNTDLVTPQTMPSVGATTFQQAVAAWRHFIDNWFRRTFASKDPSQPFPLTQTPDPFDPRQRSPQQEQKVRAAQHPYGNPYGNPYK